MCNNGPENFISLAAEKTADGLQEFLQTVKEDDVSIEKQVLPKVDARHDDRCKGRVRITPSTSSVPRSPLGDKVYLITTHRCKEMGERKRYGLLKGICVHLYSYNFLGTYSLMKSAQFEMECLNRSVFLKKKLVVIPQQKYQAQIVLQEASPSNL